MYSNRISTGARYNLLAADMKKAEEAFNRLTAQLGSGKKFLSITEDPIAAVNIVNTNRQLGQIEKFNQNVEMAKTEINTMDEILSLATGYLSTALLYESYHYLHIHHYLVSYPKFHSILHKSAKIFVF